MRFAIGTGLVIGLLWTLAGTARADTGPTTREIQAAVDAYLATAQADAHLVGGRRDGYAGYDQGFWLRKSDFSLKLGLTLQARYEAWMWDSDQRALLGAGNDVGGSLSGFSLPRATLRFSGTAPCNMSYYLELEFGHPGRNVTDAFQTADPLGPLVQSYNFDTAREAWIEWTESEQFSFRVGQIRTATTRQAMIAPELQQFVDVSLATAYMGWTMPGYTDRNRDHGLAMHGEFGLANEWSYLFTVTNGDGADSIRNLIDQRTSDNFAYSARLNWAFAGKVGYQEGAVAQQTCRFYGEVGAWAWYYADRVDRAHVQMSNARRFGLDLALGYAGWSLTAAYNSGRDDLAVAIVNHQAFLVQLGFLIPGTPWEIAARWDGYDSDNTANIAGAQQIPLGNGAVSEFALAINYYLNGHGNKLTLDASYVEGQDAGSRLLFDPYTGYYGARTGAAGQGNATYGTLIRFQWQLAL